MNNIIKLMFFTFMHSLFCMIGEDQALAQVDNIVEVTDPCQAFKMRFGYSPNITQPDGRPGPTDPEHCKFLFKLILSSLVQEKLKRSHQPNFTADSESVNGLLQMFSGDPSREGTEYLQKHFHNFRLTCGAKDPEVTMTVKPDVGCISSNDFINELIKNGVCRVKFALKTLHPKHGLKVTNAEISAEDVSGLLNTDHSKNLSLVDCYLLCHGLENVYKSGLFRDPGVNPFIGALKKIHFTKIAAPEVLPPAVFAPVAE